MNKNSSSTKNYIHKISIDGLVIAKFSRSVLKKCRKEKLLQIVLQCLEEFQPNYRKFNNME